MSEICLKCWNKINGTEDGEGKYVLSRGLELCEDCGELKHIFITERSSSHVGKFIFVYILIAVIWSVIYFVCRLFGTFD